MGLTTKNRVRLSVTQLLAGRVLRVRMIGSAAIDLSWLAEGWTDASVTLSNRSWDVAAGVVVAREAGALVMDYDGSEHTVDSAAVIATSGKLAPELLDILRSVPFSESDDAI